MDETSTLRERIARLKRERRAVILAHYYTTPDVQAVADFLGDSLALAVQAQSVEAETILFAGVHFMAETAKVLCPDKRVLIPTLEAGCSLAESCDAGEFARFRARYPDHTVVSYVNTSVGVKALTDICCTSSNALRVVESLPADRPVLFAPDRNLGSYIQRLTGRTNMVLWDGACHVHERFSPERIAELKAAHPDAPVLAHPECRRPVLLLADKVGSTAALLEYALASPAKEFIVATESGILHQMRKGAPEKTFIAAPPTDSTCGCNECAYMKLNTLAKLRDCLRDGKPEIQVDPELAERALRPIERMLSLC